MQGAVSKGDRVKTHGQSTSHAWDMKAKRTEGKVRRREGRKAISEATS